MSEKNIPTRSYCVAPCGMQGKCDDHVSGARGPIREVVDHHEVCAFYRPEGNGDRVRFQVGGEDPWEEVEPEGETEPEGEKTPEPEAPVEPEGQVVGGSLPDAPREAEKETEGEPAEAPSEGKRSKKK